MPTVELTVRFNATVPEGTKVDNLCLNLNLANVSMIDVKTLNPVDAKFVEYETVNVEELS